MKERRDLPWAVYIRVSTKDQATKFSPAKQLAAAAAWAKANGVTVPDINNAVTGNTVRRSEFILMDAQTGKNDDRPDFQQVMELARGGKIGGLIGFCVDRVARNLVDAIKLRTTLKRMGVRLEFATQTFDDSPSGDMMYAIFSAFAQFEGAVILERTASGRLDRVRGVKGEKPRLHSGGAVRYGYRYENGFPIIDEQEAPVARLILRTFDEGETAYKIFQRLNREGYRTRKGKKFFHGTVTQLLRKADGYAGAYTHRHGLEAAKREHAERVAEMGENAASLDLSAITTIHIEDFYPPLIDKETAARIKARLSLNKKKAGSNPTKSLLAKMIWCMNGEHKWHARWTRKGGAYACGKVDRHGTFRKLCHTRQVPCPVMDNTILDGLKDYLRRPEVARALALQNHEATQGPDAKRRRGDLEKRLSAIQREQNHLDAQMLDYDLPQRTRDLAKKRLKEVEIEMLNIKAELREKSTTMLPSEPAIVAAFTELLDEMDHLETFEDKREFIESTVSQVRTDGETIEIEGNITLETPNVQHDRNCGVGSDLNYAAYIPFKIKRIVESAPRRKGEGEQRRVA